MYEFLLDCWIRKTISSEKIRSVVPRRITQEECNKILNTPQSL